MLLESKNLEKLFPGPSGDVRALDDLSLSIAPGEFVAVEGESGCGKTTLLLVAGGLLRPDKGQITLLGQDVYALTANQRAAFRAQAIGFVFQQFHLVPYLTVRENMLTPTLAASTAETSARADALLEQLRLSPRAEHTPAMLSTGERQRTAIARAVLLRPKLLLADEPTGNLDQENAQIVLDYLAAFAADGGGVLLVTHDPRAAARAHRRYHMTAGRF